jgi:hypothetical protein
MSARAEDLKLVTASGAVECAGFQTRRRDPLFTRLLRMLFPDERRQERISVPPLVGYLGTMRATRPYEIGDISSSGFCLLTDERWETGTEMPITLQRTNLDGQTEAECFTVQATVVRSGEAGIGFSIVLSEEESNAAHGNRLQVRWASKAEMEGFLRRMQGEPDSALGIPGIAQTKPASYLGCPRSVQTHSAGD